MRDPIAEFKEFNQPFAKRSPDLYRVKVARMAEDPFAFFRGTFHLFARDVLDKIHGAIPLLAAGTGEMDLIGDIHSENYGTYQSTHGAIYYGINDFDETIRGSPEFDVCRLAVSIFLASRNRGDPLADATRVTLGAVSTYAEAMPRYLKRGADVGVHETAPCGCAAIDDLVHTAAAYKRTEFIAKLTQATGGQRRLARSQHYFNLPDEQREQATRLLNDYVSRMPAPTFADYYKVEDICGRVAGIGSMGRSRYVLLIAGKGSKEGRNLLIELKEARPSAYDLYRQRDLDDHAVVRRAEEVIGRQKLLQVAINPHLGYAVDGKQSFQVREIGPHDFRVNLGTLKNIRMWEKVAAVQASTLACSHARSVAHAVGLASPMAHLSQPEDFCQRVLTFALTYADIVKQDWTKFAGQRAELDRWQGYTSRGQE